MKWFPLVEEGSPLSTNWHYIKNGQRFGPVSEDRLRQLATAGEVGSSDLLWREGMAQWVPAQAAPW